MLTLRYAKGRLAFEGRGLWRLSFSTMLPPVFPGAEILASYPALRSEDIDAALAYAAESVREGSTELPAELTA